MRKINVIYSWIILGLTMVGTTACNKDKGLSNTDNSNIDNTKQVVFEIKTEWNNSPASSNEAGDDQMPDAFLVKEEQDYYSLIDNGTDTWKSDGNSGYTLSKNLEIGKYHFAIMKGTKRVNSSQEGNNGNFCYINTQNYKYNSLQDIEIVHPYENDMLKDCNLMYLDENENKFAEVVDLNGNGEGKDNHRFNAELTHAQARVDVVVVKAVKNNEGGYDIIDENPFENNKISDITLTFNGINNACKLENSLFFKKDNVPTSYKRTINASEFANFNYNEYKNGFQGNDPFKGNEKLEMLTDENLKNVKIFDKGIYLFPTEDDSNGKIEFKLTVNYNKETGLEPTEGVISEGIKSFNRNNVRLIVVWLLNEKFEVVPDIDVSNELPNYEDGVATGDEGFWN